MALDWSDLRHFLAVARTGSTLGAARLLGVNQTTSARRIAALEEELGFPLFDRGREGYKLVERAAPLVEAAERVEAAVNAFLNDAAGAGRTLTGTIRMTTNEPLANALVGTAVSEFRKAYPGMKIDLLINDALLDIARGEADVAMRVGTKPTDPCLVVRQMPQIGWFVYCSQDYAERVGAPTGPESLDQHDLVSFDRQVADWVHHVAPGLPIAAVTNSMSGLSAMIRSGSGVGGLPCVVGDLDPGLRRCFAIPQMARPLWLTYHERLRGTPHIRAFLDFLVAHVLAKRSLLTGEDDSGTIQRSAA